MATLPPDDDAASPHSEGLFKATDALKYISDNQIGNEEVGKIFADWADDEAHRAKAGKIMHELAASARKEVRAAYAKELAAKSAPAAAPTPAATPAPAAGAAVDTNSDGAKAFPEFANAYAQMMSTSDYKKVEARLSAIARDFQKIEIADSANNANGRQRGRDAGGDIANNLDTINPIVRDSVAKMVADPRRSDADKLKLMKTMVGDENGESVLSDLKDAGAPEEMVRSSAMDNFMETALKHSNKLFYKPANGYGPPTAHKREYDFITKDLGVRINYASADKVQERLGMASPNLRYDGVHEVKAAALTFPPKEAGAGKQPVRDA